MRLHLLAYGNDSWWHPATSIFFEIQYIIFVFSYEFKP